MCSNVILEIPGLVNPSRIVVVGAHLDSRNVQVTATGTPAPGADDNASGSGTNLEFARVIASTGRRFQNSIHIMWFCGEEQGLLGSAAIAKNYASLGKNVIGMFNLDMIGYLPPGNTIIMAFMTGSATKTFTDACKAIIPTYVPGLALGSTSACCSDQQSFYNNGYQALGAFETATSGVAYPDYHRETDTYTKVNFDQVFAFAKGMMSCVAEWSIPV
jgi:Zn-dependent M28 family amino/carboxypeptidase